MAFGHIETLFKHYFLNMSMAYPSGQPKTIFRPFFEYVFLTHPKPFFEYFSKYWQLAQSRGQRSYKRYFRNCMHTTGLTCQNSRFWSQFVPGSVQSTIQDFHPPQECLSSLESSPTKTMRIFLEPHPE